MATQRADIVRMAVLTRWLICTTGVLAIGVAVCLVMLFSLTRSQGTGLPTGTGTLTVSRLLIADSNGQVRAEISASELGATITLMTPSGKDGITLSTSGGEPKVALFDEKGRPRLQFYVTNVGGATQYLGQNGPRIWMGESAAGGGLILHDFQTTPRAEVGLIDYGPGRVAPRSLLNLFSAEGQVIYSVKRAE